MLDAIELTKKLIQFNTTNPPGCEEDCGIFVAEILEKHGFSVERQKYGDRHINIIAKLAAENPDAAPLLMTGHLDTVPLGKADWEEPPFDGIIKDGKLHGRGASDMKSGVAAMIVAACNIARNARGDLYRGITLVFTSGEETGCAGALHLVETQELNLGSASAMIVGEPTANQMSTAHKGALFIQARTTGVTAHSSMPEAGVNAVYKTARAITNVENYGFNDAPHPLLGSPTINVGMVSGGLNVNSVPDQAGFTIDIRTNARKPHDAFFSDLKTYLGKDVELEAFTDMPAISTDINDPFTVTVAKACEKFLNDDYNSDPKGLPFFTDASALHPHYQCPTIILGPGEPAVMHQTNEFCYIHRIEQAVDIYTEIARKWCLSPAE